MENKPSMSRVERLHREKVTRYSIRKYSFGAASVAVAALFMFLGNGAVSADMTAVQPQDTSEIKVKPTEENTGSDNVQEDTTKQVDNTVVAEAPAKSEEVVTPTLDKTQLESYISEIETKLSNGSYDNKTEESVAVLKADLEAAKATLSNATTQAEITKAYNKLVTTANTKLKNKPTEKKETPAVDTTEGKETVGKSAENTEKKPDSNSIENTGSKDERNGKVLDKDNAFRAETTATQGTFIMKKTQMSILQLTQQLEISKEQQLKLEVVSSY
ncbi:YSIRK-type signal peptide-containing protein [Streptococcus mitis]|uniref:YSIRK-type signal peptide-containing protein n=1 Tax=Streptococcus mitis TaxID=28037 RepID=UPI0039C140FD